MIKLSPSALSKFNACPRCFWLERVQNLPAPRGIFPTLPSGMDRIIKVWYDRHRGTSTLPLEIRWCAPGLLFNDQKLLEQWRSWKTGLQAKLTKDIIVSGALDDLLYDSATELYYVLDYKTRGSAPRPGATEEYYSIQGDSYALMLEANKMSPGPEAYFVYYWPVQAVATDSAFPPANIKFEFQVQAVKIPVKPKRAKELALKAARCLTGKIPLANISCELCPYTHERSILERKMIDVGERSQNKAGSLAR